MAKWFEMKKQDGADGNGAKCEILIYDFIGKDFWTGEGMDAADFEDELKECGDVTEILLRINSPGGVVADGIAIYNMLTMHPAKITARVDGIAASVASLIYMAADVREIPANSFLLIHEPSTYAWGTADELVAAAADLERMSTVFASTYEKCSTLDNEGVRALMKEDRLMTAAEAIEGGFADVLIDHVKMVACQSIMALPPKAREAFKAAMQTSETVTPPSELGTDLLTSADNVVDLDAARMQAGDETRAEMLEIVELCTLAGLANQAQTMIANKKTVAQVRAELVSMRAAQSAAEELNGRHGAPVNPSATAKWDDVIAKTNQRR